MKNYLLVSFAKAYGYSEDVQVYFAPGRVNLIGEHTDYNGGFVFPCALSIGTYAAVAKRNDRNIRLFSANFEQDGVITVLLDDLSFAKEHGWANYPLGVMHTLSLHGFNMDCGLDIMYYGNIPNGAGLSSSASIEVLTGFFLRDLYGFDFSDTNIALMSQEAENKYIGVNCGIMDQFAIAMGREGHAILLDTATLNYRYAPLNLSDYKIVIMNTNKKRTLADSKYNERRSECEAALAILQKERPIDTLCQLSPKEFDEVSHLITDPVLMRRARHAVYENHRTILAQTCLDQGNLASFGQLMYESHTSLHNDYEVTGIELDTLVDIASQCSGVLGARMTGAGFGGCAIALVHSESIDSFIAKAGSHYLDRIGYQADFYVVSSGFGPTIL